MGRKDSFINGQGGPEELARRFHASGGFTVELPSGRVPATGWVSSIEKHGVQAAPEDVTPRTVSNYLVASSDELGRANRVAGAWNDTDVTPNVAYLDVNRISRTKRAGMRSMARENQKAMYNLKSGQEVKNPMHPENARPPMRQMMVPRRSGGKTTRSKIWVPIKET